MALVALYLGKAVLVVGDHEQVSPSAVGQDLGAIQNPTSHEVVNQVIRRAEELRKSWSKANGAGARSAPVSEAATV